LTIWAYKDSSRLQNSINTATSTKQEQGMHTAEHDWNGHHQVS